MITKLVMISALLLAPGLFVVAFAPRRYRVGRILLWIGFVFVSLSLLKSLTPQQSSESQWDNPPPLSKSSRYANVDAAMMEFYDTNESIFNALYTACLFGILILADTLKWRIKDRGNRTELSLTPVVSKQNRAQQTPSEVPSKAGP